MRNTKLWSVLLVCVLLCACVLGVLFTGASAESAVIYGVGYTEGVDKSFDTIEAAFDDVEAIVEAGNWPEGQSLEILFAGTIEAKVSGSELVFGQKTIFTSTGKKLPITIKGTEEGKASTIKVTADKIACANDYTFENLTLDLHSHVVGTATFASKEYNLSVSFFAGSGNVTLKNLTSFNLGSHVFGDNYTAEAFEGWTEADVDALKDEDGCLLSSVTFTGTGFASTEVLGESSTNSIDAGPCAVGATRNSETGEDAYAAVISENLTITPADTKAMLEVTSGELKSRLGGYMAQYPARVHTAIIRMTGGSVNSVTGDEAGGHVLNNIENGNVEVYVKDVERAGTVRIFYGGKGHHDMTNTANAPAGEYGNVTVYCENVKRGGDVYIDGSSNKIIPGKAKVTLKNFYHNGKSTSGEMTSFEYLGLAALGGVENNLTKCKLAGYSGCRFENAPSVEIGDVVNNLTDVNYAGNKSLWNYNPVAMRNKDVGVKVKSVTNNLTDCIIGSSTSYAISFYGTRSSVVSGTVKNVLNDTTFNYPYYGSNNGSAARVENYYNAGSTFAGEIRGTNGGTVKTVENEVAGAAINGVFYGIHSTAVSDTVKNVLGGSAFKGKYYGTESSSVGRVENHYNAGSTFAEEIRGTNGGTVGTVVNVVDGATVNNNLQGTYNTKITGKVETTVKSGTLSALYVAFGHSSSTIGDIVNNIYGGTFKGDIMFGGYGGPSIKSVTTNIYDGNFNNANKFVAFASGNNNWTSQVLGDVVNNIYGGTFKQVVYGGARGGCVQGDVYNNVKSGVFEGKFYGGNYAPTYYKDKYTWYNSFLYKGIEGTIYNTFGEQGKTEPAPHFKNTVYGGDRGILSTTAYANKSDCTIENTIYNATFDYSFYGGNDRDAYLSYQTDLDGYGIAMNITNNVYGGDFKMNFFGGSVAESHVPKTDTIAAKITSGKITNNIYGGTFTDSYVGSLGQKSANATLDTFNNIYGGTFVDTENFLGSANYTEIVGTVTNTFYAGFATDTAYFYGGGAGIVRAPEGKKAIVNVIHGGSFDGFWGAGGNANLVVYGDVETTIYDGYFGTYDNNNLINGVTSGPRNSILNGNAVMNIYGGDFVGQVCGGTFLGSADYKDRLINGSTELNIYGGTFRRSIFACSPTSTVYATEGSTLNIAQTEGKELAIYATVGQCDSFAANGEAIKIGKNTAIVAENVSGTVSLNQTQGWLCKKYFTIVSGNGKFGEITTASGAFGNYATEDYMVGEEGPAYVTRLYGTSTDPIAASLILDQKLTVRVLFDPEEIAPYGTDFTFAAALGENALDTVFEEYTVDGVTYASYLIKGIGLGNFTEAIEISGAALDTMTFSVVGLADEGAEYYATENAIASRLFKSIADLGRKENGEDAEYDLVVSAVNWTPADDQMPKALDERLSMKTVGLIMSDAIGIRLNGETAETLKFIVNGKDVTSNCVVTASEGTFTADMYVKVSMMTSPLNIVITDGEGNAMFTMTVRVDALAEQIAASTEAEAELIDFALAYVQAADAYAKA